MFPEKLHTIHGLHRLLVTKITTNVSKNKAMQDGPSETATEPLATSDFGSLLIRFRLRPEPTSPR